MAHYREFDMTAQGAIARLVGQAAANQAMFFDFSRNSSVVSVILVLHTASTIPHPGSEKKGPGDDWHLNWSGLLPQRFEINLRQVHQQRRLLR